MIVKRLFYKKEYWIVFFIYFIMNSLFFRALVYNSGYINSGDFFSPLMSRDFLDIISNMYLQSEKGQVFNHVFTKNIIYFPLHILNFLGLNSPMTKVYYMYFAILSPLSGICIYYTFNNIILGLEKKTKSNFLITLASFTSGFLYLSSTIIIEQQTHPFILYCYYLIPWLILCLFKFHEAHKKRYLIFTVIIWTVMTGMYHMYIYIPILLVCFFSFYSLYDYYISDISLSKILKLELIPFLAIFVIFIFVNSFILYNIINSNFVNEVTANLSVSNIGVLYNNASFTNIFAFKANPFLASRYGLLPLFNTFSLNISNFILIIMFSLSILSIYYARTLKHTLYLWFFLLVSIFISIGPNYFTALFNAIFLEHEYAFLFKRAFRTPKFHMFIIYPFSILFALFIYYFIKSNKRMLQACIIIIICYLFANYTLLTGNFNGNLRIMSINFAKKINALATVNTKSIVYPYNKCLHYILDTNILNSSSDKVHQSISKIIRSTSDSVDIKILRSYNKKYSPDFLIINLFRIQSESINSIPNLIRSPIGMSKVIFRDENFLILKL